MNSLSALPALPQRNKSHILSTQKEVAEEEGAKTYYLDAVQAPLDSDEDDLEFEEVPMEEFDDVSDSDGEETLDKAVRSLNDKGLYGGAVDMKKPIEVIPTFTKQAEVVDDYIRNYLASKGLMKSLEAFQNEWYELGQNGKLKPEDKVMVPDVYKQTQSLSETLQKIRVELENYQDIASKARATYDKLRKERDFHRMHHKRVVQEKNKLINDIKRLKKHYDSYDPTLKQLQHKYETAMKEKMLIKLERDKLAVRMEKMDIHQHKNESTLEASLIKKKEEVKKKEGGLPVDDRTNPYFGVDLPQAKLGRLRLVNTIKAHTMAISSAKFHPKKPILATVSDDKTWKMWSFPTGELVMSGEGHKDWIADCDFHPKGAHLATASGDGTVKIWDFSKGVATSTFTDHTQAVWSVAFHDTGDFVLTASMDHTARLFDVQTGKCRQTIRGHGESVNYAGFIPFTNTIYTCSGDKTISLWDARTGLCTHTLYGHLNAVSNVTSTLRGDTLASSDADGVVKIWDIRSVSETKTIDMGPMSANRVAFDPSGFNLAIASDDSKTKLFSIKDNTRIKDLEGHEDAVQAVLFDKSGDYLVSCGSDCTIRVYQ